jgi:hypothetical protein
VEEATSWFQAINDKNGKATIAHFAPASRDQMQWISHPVEPIPSFSNVECKQLSATRTSAEVHCTFNQSQIPGEQNDDFWTISMQRVDGGPWLINNYGQP